MFAYFALLYWYHFKWCFSYHVLPDVKMSNSIQTMAWLWHSADLDDTSGFVNERTISMNRSFLVRMFIIGCNVWSYARRGVDLGLDLFIWIAVIKMICTVSLAPLVNLWNIICSLVTCYAGSIFLFIYEHHICLLFILFYFILCTMSHFDNQYLFSCWCTYIADFVPPCMNV